MEPAAARIADAVGRGEQVAIFGDYDVDGATASALLARFLRAAGLDPIIHIPDRIFEGYGPNVDAIRSLAGRGATLLITVDCGTTSLEPLAEARRLGLDVIVIDHHQADERLPDALRTRVLHRWSAALGAPRSALSHRHVGALDALVTAWHGQGPVSLPGGIRVIRREGVLVREGP